MDHKYRLKLIKLSLYNSFNRVSYMSLTAHFIGRQFKLKARTLAIEHISGSHSGEKIQNSIKELLRSYNIANKIQSITSDNGWLNSYTYFNILKYIEH